MKTVKIMLRWISAVGIVLFAVALITPAYADMVMRESDIVDLRLGQKVFVDDGSCPAGQIKLVTGAKLSAGHALPTKRCVDRKGIKR